jgi:hypothetical protein
LEGEKITKKCNKIKEFDNCGERQWVYQNFQDYCLEYPHNNSDTLAKVVLSVHATTEPVALRVCSNGFETMGLSGV